jgi:hypothetical protein
MWSTFLFSPKKHYNSSSDELCSSSSGRSAFFKLFNSLFSICQSNKQSMDVIHEHQEVLLENQRNLHQKMQVE